MTVDRAAKAASNALYYANRHGMRTPRPACMDDAEWTAWWTANERLYGESRADSPCRDCTPLFHRDMWEGGMCDGMPGPHPGGRPAADPEHLRGLSLDELHVLRAEWPYKGAPADLRMAVSRARWREYRRGLREAMA